MNSPGGAWMLCAPLLASLLTPLRLPAEEALAQARLPYRVESEHLVCMTDVSAEYAKGRAADLETFHRILTSRLPFPPAPRARLPRVYIFGMREALDAIRSSAYPQFLGRPAFFVYEFAPERREDRSQWTFHLATWRRPSDDETRRELFHEFTHAVLHLHVPSPPLWLDEGLSEYFEVVEPARDAGDSAPLNRADLLPLRASVLSGSQLSLEAVLGMGAEGAGPVTNLHYDEAWSLLHFFRHGRGGMLSAPFDAFLLELARGRNWEEALAEKLLPVVEPCSRAGLEAAWLEHVKSLR
ncbi:MAG: hypothetical protein HYZ53_28170 [Planctomycetes bacterium]|nr:hypothetical protein [Planctomycetota bacterium]